jgi:hypothetical protein
MDRDRERDHLAQAEQYIAEVKKHIARQRESVENAIKRGHRSKVGKTCKKESRWQLLSRFSWLPVDRVRRDQRESREWQVPPAKKAMPVQRDRLVLRERKAIRVLPLQRDPRARRVKVRFALYAPIAQRVLAQRRVIRTRCL